MNNIAPKLQKCWTHIIPFRIISKNAKTTKFLYCQPSRLPKDAPAKFYLSTTFGLSFMIRSVAPTRSSTFYAYLITKIRNHNLSFKKSQETNPPDTPDNKERQCKMFQEQKCWEL